MNRKAIVIFLAISLVVLVVYNFYNTWHMQCDLVSEINTLEGELGTARQEKARLEQENKIMAQEAYNWLVKFQDVIFFLESIETDISNLLSLTKCTNCCGVTKLLPFGPSLERMKEQINFFKEVKHGGK